MRVKRTKESINILCVSQNGTKSGVPPVVLSTEQKEKLFLTVTTPLLSNDVHSAPSTHDTEKPASRAMQS